MADNHDETVTAQNAGHVIADTIPGMVSAAYTLSGSQASAVTANPAGDLSSQVGAHLPDSQTPASDFAGTVDVLTWQGPK